MKIHEFGFYFSFYSYFSVTKKPVNDPNQVVVSTEAHLKCMIDLDGLAGGKTMIYLECENGVFPFKHDLSEASWKKFKVFFCFSYDFICHCFCSKNVLVENLKEQKIATLVTVKSSQKKIPAPPPMNLSEIMQVSNFLPIFPILPENFRPQAIEWEFLRWKRSKW